MLKTPLQSNLNPTPRPRAIGVDPRGLVMSQWSKMRHSRDQWKSKAKQRGEGQRYQRKEHARLRSKHDQVTQTLKATQTRLRQLEAQLQGLPTRPQVEVVHVGPATLCRGAHQLPRGLARPRFTGECPWHPEGTVPANRHQLGDPARHRAYRLGPHSAGLTPFPCWLKQGDSGSKAPPRARMDPPS
jgi:hypothetical protein